VLLDALTPETENSHSLVHLVEAVGMIVILVVQEIENAIEPFVSERNPFGLA